ncbi:MAG: transcription termination/antitermination protein NusG [Balneolaceae bacterium]
MGNEQVHDWYVIRCFSSHEKKVKEFLDREIEEQGLQDKITEVLVPTETVVEIRGGKKRTREKNFFPGYILINTHYDEEVNNLVQSAPSCLGFLKVGKAQTVPQPLKKHEINRIIGRVKDSVEENQNIRIPYSEGDLVKVIAGPFKDFDGTVQEVNTDKLKLRVLVSIFGRRTPVEVDVSQVESAT